MDYLLFDNKAEEDEGNGNEDENEQNEENKIIALALPAFHVYGHIASCQVILYG